MCTPVKFWLDIGGFHRLIQMRTAGCDGPESERFLDVFGQVNNMHHVTDVSISVRVCAALAPEEAPTNQRHLHPARFV